jgi:segregation and condensation protein B
MAKTASLAQTAEPASGDETMDEPVTKHPRADVGHALRVIEAVLFASAEPVAADDLASALPEGTDVVAVLEDLKRFYARRGVNLVQVAGRWAFRTAGDLSFLLRREAVEQRRLSRAALETLAIIAYHQPVTRADIEDIRGVAISKGTLDTLMEIGWVKLRGRRRTPGRPVTYGTTSEFLEHFGLNETGDLPGLAELKAAGLLDQNLPPDFLVPSPASDDALGPDEDPLGEADELPALEMDLPEAIDGDDEPERT